MAAAALWTTAGLLARTEVLRLPGQHQLAELDADVPGPRVVAAVDRPLMRWRWVRMAVTGRPGSRPAATVSRQPPWQVATGPRVVNRSAVVTGLEDRVAVQRAEQRADEGRVVDPAGGGHDGHDPGGCVVGLLEVDLGQLGQPAGGRRGPGRPGHR